jgi:DNA-binding beta-propeller fold protein YncE
MKRRKGAAACSVLVFGLLTGLLLAQDGALSGVQDMDALNAAEAFRTGLDAYNRFYFNNAILSFEKALNYRPGEGLILDYLGKAYYRSGMEENALREWLAAAAAYGPEAPETLLIRSRSEVVRNRRSLYAEMNDEPRFVEVGHFPGSSGGLTFFSQPSAVLRTGDGSSWVVAYGSNEIIRVDVNGVIRERHRGPAAGFDRPYDIARGLDGRLYVSEFRGGRISVLSGDGVWLSYIGSKGLREGNLLGPANMALDDEGYIYVVDYGNRRVSKFDPGGLFITTFGEKSLSFSGFISPTGIACLNETIYVADGIANTISMFDTNGLYLGPLLDEGLSAPESLRVSAGGDLLVADTKRLLLVDPQTAIVRELTAAGNSRVRLIGAGVDINGSILAADFNSNEVTVLSALDNVAGGLFVQVERIIADDFPDVTLELSVCDRMRNPVAGLDQNNFVITEKGNPVQEQIFEGAGNRVASADIAVIVERSPETRELPADLRAAVRDIQAALAGLDGEAERGRIVSIVSAGAIPVKERFNAQNPESLAQAAVAGAYSAAWRFDNALRLAVDELLPRSPKRAIVFVSSGRLGDAAFTDYELSNLAALLANNNVVFYAVLVSDADPSGELRYLSSETGGQILRLYSRQGIGGAIGAIAARPAGTYVFQYRSALQADSGRAFLPVDVEVYLLERSGRDAAGFFPPLE